MNKSDALHSPETSQLLARKEIAGYVEYLVSFLSLTFSQRPSLWSDLV